MVIFEKEDDVKNDSDDDDNGEKHRSGEDRTDDYASRHFYRGLKGLRQVWR